MFTANGEADFYNPGQFRLLRFVNDVVAPMDPELAANLRKSVAILSQPAVQPDPSADAFVPEEVPPGQTRTLPSLPARAP